jgi:hypothetical protein
MDDRNTAYKIFEFLRKYRKKRDAETVDTPVNQKPERVEKDLGRITD